MKYLKRLSEWSELDWSILLLILIIALVVWSIILLIFHFWMTRRQVKKVQDRYDRLVKPFMFGDNNQTVKENFNTQKLNKDEW